MNGWFVPMPMIGLMGVTTIFVSTGGGVNTATLPMVALLTSNPPMTYSLPLMAAALAA